MGVRPHADDPLAGSLFAAGSALVDSHGAGPDQPSNAAALATHNDAAVGYMAAGRLADAASQFEQALDRCSLLLGLRHPDTLISATLTPS